MGFGDLLGRVFRDPSAAAVAAPPAPSAAAPQRKVVGQLKVTEDVQAEIVRLCNLGMTQADIAQELGLDPATVSRWVRTLMARPAGQEAPPERPAAMLSQMAETVRELNNLTATIREMAPTPAAAAPVPMPDTDRSRYGGYRYDDGPATVDDVIAEVEAEEMRSLMADPEVKRAVRAKLLRRLNDDDAGPGHLKGIREAVAVVADLREQLAELAPSAPAGPVTDSPMLEFARIMAPYLAPVLAPMVQAMAGRAAGGAPPLALPAPAVTPDQAAVGPASTGAVSSTLEKLFGVFAPSDLTDVLAQADPNLAATTAWARFVQGYNQLPDQVAMIDAYTQLNSFVTLDLAVLRAASARWAADPAWGPLLAQLYGKPEDWLEAFRGALEDYMHPEDAAEEPDDAPATPNDAHPAAPDPAAAADLDGPAAESPAEAGAAESAEGAGGKRRYRVMRGNGGNAERRSAGGE